MAAPRYDVAGRLAVILPLLKGVEKTRDGYRAICPVHDDHRPSLDLKLGDSGAVIMVCRAGCDTSAIVRAVGLEWKDLFPEKPKEASGARRFTVTRGGGPILAQYDYYDRDGATLLFQVLRKPNKQFPQRSPNGEGKWKWGLEGVERVLYRLPELLAGVRAGRGIFVVEGEKDVENLMKLGFVATTNPGGAGKWRDEYTDDFRGAVAVTILPDNDDAGRKHAHQIAAALHGVARQVRIVELPGVDKKGDVSDWIELVGNRQLATEKLKELVRKTAPWSPAAAPAVETPITPLLEGGEERSDMGNARRLVARHGTQLRHVGSIGWFAWAGDRWERDETGEIHRRAKECVRWILHEAADATSATRRGELMAWARQSQNAARIDAMIRVASTEPEIAARADRFDGDPWLLNVANGTIDLRTGVLGSHRREDYITRRSPASYDPAADWRAAAPVFAATLDRVFAGNARLIEFLQRAVGYTLTGITTEQVVFFWHGSGANGKSVLMELFRAMLGDYATQADFSSFLETRADGPRNDLAALAGARLVSASESADGRAMAENVVKHITGGEAIKARFLHKEFFEFRPQFKVVLISNHKPKIRGTDEGIWRRIRMVPFNVTIPESERDPQLLARLTAELPGVLRWAVEGCLAWQRGGLGAPPEVREATASYRAESDLIGAFLADCCELRPLATASARELHEAYQKWAQEQGERPLAARTLGAKLGERAGLASRKSHGTVLWIGLELKAPADRKTGHPEETPSQSGEDRGRIGAEQPELTLSGAAQGGSGEDRRGASPILGICPTDLLMKDDSRFLAPHPPLLPLSPLSPPIGGESERNRAVEGHFEDVAIEDDDRGDAWEPE